MVDGGGGDNYGGWVADSGENIPGVGVEALTNEVCLYGKAIDLCHIMFYLIPHHYITLNLLI